MKKKIVGFRSFFIFIFQFWSISVFLVINYFLEYFWTFRLLNSAKVTGLDARQRGKLCPHVFLIWFEKIWFKKVRIKKVRFKKSLKKFGSKRLKNIWFRNVWFENVWFVKIRFEKVRTCSIKTDLVQIGLVWKFWFKKIWFTKFRLKFQFEIVWFGKGCFTLKRYRSNSFGSKRFGSNWFD